MSRHHAFHDSRRARRGLNARPGALTGAAACGLAACALTAPCAATELLFSTGWSNYTSVDSLVCGSPALEREAADDFDLVATIERVYVNGNNPCIAVCNPPPLSGAWVRFYEWTETGPGPLQVEHFIAADDPGLAYDPGDIEDVDVTLPAPFEATGKHYVSVQLQFEDCFSWSYWIANKDAPMMGAAYERSSGGAWEVVTAFAMESSDLSYELYGTQGPPTPPKGCGLWFLQPSPNPPGMDDAWLHDMAFIAEDDIWAVGRTYGPGEFGSDLNQYTLAMHFDGDTWTIVPTPNPNPAEPLTWCELNAVAALAPDDVWAAGGRVDTDGGAGYVGPHNLVLHWDGKSWEQVDAPIPPSFGAQGVSGDSIHEILALAANDIWFFGEWITLNAQGSTFRYALAMHYDGSDFTVHDVPVVGTNGATIYAADAAAPDDIWAVGAAGDGDSATTNFSYIYHWDGTSWEHVPFAPAPGVFHGYGGVKVLAPDDVWISGSAWAPGEAFNYMLHWDGDGYEYVEVPYAGGPIVGEPPAMYVFGTGGVSVFDGETWSDAHLLEGLEALSGFGLNAITQTGPCEMLAVGTKSIAGDFRTLVARLVPHAEARQAVTPDIDGDVDVDGADLGQLLSVWGQNVPWADLDANGVVDGGDLGIMLAAWTG